MLVWLLALFGCARHKLITATSQERILAIFGAQGRLFIITDVGEYEFQKRALDIFVYLQEFMQRFSHRLSHERTLLNIDKTGDTNLTRIFHTLRLDTRGLKQAEISNLYARKSTFFQIEQGADKSLLITFHDLSGRPVNLKNRDEILAKYALNQGVWVTKNVLSKRNDIIASADDALAGVTLPIYIATEGVKILSLFIGSKR